MATPRSTRPRFAPDYGIRDAESGMGLMPWERASERISASRNYWICTTRPDGRPHAAPVWGVWVDGTLCFSSSRASRKAKNLARSPEIVVHLESGDDVVIVEGTVQQIELDDRIADAYEAKYDYRPEPNGTGGGVWYALRPRVAYAWLERDFTGSATRYEWPA